eukprot:TRINITY_DN27338_c0_g1_i1.p1 TRINITY_DN27338_c0_g1~~TRINITY_DN27338_c0_g1_i1.p1  ORF type:complete len:422 (-),score=56.20 TRINITY_DN27338_c0_g1_i1:115-1380(-)
MTDDDGNSSICGAPVTPALIARVRAALEVKETARQHAKDATHDLGPLKPRRLSRRVPAARRSPPLHQPQPREAWQDILGLDDSGQDDRERYGTLCMRPLLTPVEGAELRPEAERVEWKIGPFETDPLEIVSCRKLVIPAGRSMTSASFPLAGDEGCLRFWPNGFLSQPQRRSRGKGRTGIDESFIEAWCAVGLFMPKGTKLRLRFFVDDDVSEIRDCYWMGGSSDLQNMWLPSRAHPPKALAAPGGCAVVVGVEILENLGVTASSKVPSSRAGSLTERGEHAKGFTRLQHGAMLSKKVGPPSVASSPCSTLASPLSSRPGTPLSPPTWPARTPSPGPGSDYGCALPAPYKRPASVSGASPAQVDSGVGALLAARTMKGFALPGSRFMCPAELQRSPPRCDIPTLKTESQQRPSSRPTSARR